MKTCIGGNGTDTTAAVRAWLATGNALHLANLYLIGEPEDPMALWLTDWEAPLAWPCWGTFYPAVITRGSVTSEVSLDVQSIDVAWTPTPASWTQNVATASPYQLASLGYYDNWKVRIWTCYMSTPGDANTLGCSELFGGRVGNVTIERGKITFQVNSFLDVVKQKVPNNVIELLNTAAAYAGATPPSGFSNIPQFTVVAPSTSTVILAQQTFPNNGGILGTNLVRGGFLVFNANSSLAGMWSAIQQNVGAFIGSSGLPSSTGSGTKFNEFVLYAPFPWAPTAGDTFYVSAPSPINQTDGGDFYGFPYVPDPGVIIPTGGL